MILKFKINLYNVNTFCLTGACVLTAHFQVGFDFEIDSIEDDQSPFPNALAMVLKGIHWQNRDPFFRVSWSRLIVLIFHVHKLALHSLNPKS